MTVELQNCVMRYVQWILRNVDDVLSRRREEEGASTVPHEYDNRVGAWINAYARI